MPIRESELLGRDYGGRLGVEAMRQRDYFKKLEKITEKALEETFVNESKR